VDSVVESKQTAIVCSATQILAVSPNRSKLKQKETVVHKKGKHKYMIYSTML
jgi:hypothetical protein